MRREEATVCAQWRPLGRHWRCHPDVCGRCLKGGKWDLWKPNCFAYKKTLWLDPCLHTSIIHTYWYEQISPEYKSHKPLGLRRDNHREATKVRALHQWLRINQGTNVISIISIRILNLFPRNIGVICAVVPPPPPQSCPPAWAQPARGPSSSASSRPPPGCCVQTLLLAPGTGIHSAWCEPAKHQEHAGFTSPFLKGGEKKPLNNKNMNPNKDNKSANSLLLDNKGLEGTDTFH